MATKHPNKAYPKNATQSAFLHNIKENVISFGVGAAGSGKTFLAVGAACEAIEKAECTRIILVRPVVEAGEKLGFLPGDFNQKLDPYLRPIYDSLYDIVGVQRTSLWIEKKVIEIAPLAFMRGRTLNHSYIILDEGQNTTKEQMKMFLTRIGSKSKMIITGDLSQSDLPYHKESGLMSACNRLVGIKGISITYFNSSDVVRHPIIEDIVRAYE